MKPAEFARLVKASRQAISKACASGRLKRSLERDGQGRVIDIARDEGLREWQDAKLPQHFAAAVARMKAPSPRPPARDAPAVVPPVAAKAERRLAEILRVDMDDLQGLVVRLAPYVIEGACEAIRSQGREPTNAELARALRLDLDDEDAGFEVSAGLQRLMFEADHFPAEFAREQGREAVLANRGQS